MIKDSNGQVRLYHYGPDGLLLAETDQAGNTLVEYIYLNGQRLVMRLGTQIYYVHSNHLDAPLALTDANGDIVWQASYSPFGKVNVEIDLLPESITARFPGQYADAETGFYYNYFRDYDPEIGRYVQSDPIGLAGGINTYGYVGGNPLTFSDPLGLFSTKAHNYLIQLYGMRNLCSPSQISAVMNGSKYADNFFRGHQNSDNAHMHAMTSGAIPDKAKACELANQFINGKMKIFKNLGAGKSNLGRNNYTANSSLGMAFHTIMDNRSPAHAGFQKWDNSQIGRHGDNLPLTPFGTNTEEDLNALLSNPALIDQILNDMANLFNNGTGIDCGCYN